MKSIENVLQERLVARENEGLLRLLDHAENLIDFASNDYLGLAKSSVNTTFQSNLPKGSSGSRLISGNTIQAERTEEHVAAFHHAEAALIFNSGYDANVGLLSSIASRNDLLILDQYCHASIIDGARLSHAQLVRFRHNDIFDLEKKIKAYDTRKIVVIESLYSMHGDKAPLGDIASLCKHHDVTLIVDEAHATGIYGNDGKGLVCQHHLEHDIYARIHTFGKALGLHGAAVVGTATLRNYLINYARPFIYSTALPPSVYKDIYHTYTLLPQAPRESLTILIDYYRKKIEPLSHISFVKSTSPIQGVIVGDNNKANFLANALQEQSLFIKSILSPSVPVGDERLRICLHSFNTPKEIDILIDTLADKWQ